MDLLAAHKQLLRRLYQWSLQEAKSEAEADYPLLRNVTNPGILGFLALTEDLDFNQRLALSKSLVKNSYFQAPIEVNIEELLQDEFTLAERQLVKDYADGLKVLGRSSRFTAAVRDDCIPIEVRSLPKAVTQHLSSVMRSDFVRKEPFMWDSTVQAGNWNILTRLEFSGKAFECSFWLRRYDDPDVVSAEVYQQYLRQRMVFDYIRSLGVSQTWWIITCEQDIPPGLQAAGLICAKVMAQFPSLLQGLGVNDGQL